MKSTMKDEPVGAKKHVSVEDPKLVHSLDGNETPEVRKSMKHIFTTVYIVLILLGVGTGFLLSQKFSSAGGSVSQAGDAGTPGVVVGSADTETFKDTAEGIIEQEGIGGVGTHKLLREGGPSQTACLVSSVLDMDEYIGKKVKIWGKTESSTTCSWLLDVGRLEPTGE